jgi:muramoyltetrapeptide carboxypeptidase
MGYTIALPALMGRIRDAESYARACTYLRAQGHTLIEDPNVHQTHGYFAAPDEVRLATFHAMLAQRPDIVMPVRGGYGVTRLLAQMDWGLIHTCGAKFIGFSDFTGFALAALTRGIVTYAGPMATSEFGRTEIELFMERECWRTLASGQCSVFVESAGPESAPQVSDRDRIVEGTLWGTNLSLISHCVGTPFMPQIEDGILLVEEIDEEPYAVDRMLMQLHHAGILQKQRALVFGAINGFKPETAIAQGYTFDDLVADLRRRVDFPILTGFPFGHIAAKATLPIGGRAALRIGEGGYTLAVKSTTT